MGHTSHAKLIPARSQYCTVDRQVPWPTVSTAHINTAVLLYSRLFGSSLINVIQTIAFLVHQRQPQRAVTVKEM